MAAARCPISSHASTSAGTTSRRRTPRPRNRRANICAASTSTAWCSARTCSTCASRCAAPTTCCTAPTIRTPSATCRAAFPASMLYLTQLEKESGAATRSASSSSRQERARLRLSGGVAARFRNLQNRAVGAVLELQPFPGVTLQLDPHFVAVHFLQRRPDRARAQYVIGGRAPLQVRDDRRRKLRRGDVCAQCRATGTRHIGANILSTRRFAVKSVSVGRLLHVSPIRPGCSA